MYRRSYNITLLKYTNFQENEHGYMDFFNK